MNNPENYKFSQVILPKKKYLLYCIFCLFAFVNNINAQSNNRPNIDSLTKKKCCLGWREWAKLPKLFQERIMVKVDSGAKTSSLHAENIRIFEKENEEWVKFTVFPRRDSKKIKYELETKVIEIKNIRSSNGKMSIRPVIETAISVGGKSWPIEITLVDRSVMGYRMLLGRTAFSSNFLVDSGKSFILSEQNISPPLKKTVSASQGRVTKSFDYIRKIRGSILGKFIETGIALLLVILFRFYISRMIKKKTFHSPAAKKRFAVYTRNSTVIIFLIALFLIWSSEFKTVSIYLMAISVATVLMMREVIRNLHGGFLLTGSRPFIIGDLINIKDVRGEVIDTNFMTTKIAEVGKNGIGSKQNGHIITLPNSIFLNHSIKNETHQLKFINHTFDYHLKDLKNWKEKEAAFYNIIEEATASYKNDAEEFVKIHNESEFSSKIDLDPLIFFSFSSSDRVTMTIKIIVPSDKKEDIESFISREFLKRMYKHE